MAIVWSIPNVLYDVKGLAGDNQIKKINWRCDDTETVDGNKLYATVQGTMQMAQPSGTFIKYEDVTEANCIAWLKNTLGTTEVARIEALVAKKLAVAKAPPTEKHGTPW